MAFLEWWDNDPWLLWIKGDSGKRKTMIMIAFIKELKTTLGLDTLFYFSIRVPYLN